MSKVIVPASLKHPLFFPAETVIVPRSASLETPPYFIYELQENEVPWENPSLYLKMVDEAYQSLQPLIETTFKEQDQAVHSMMKASLALFFMSLFWSNHKPVVLNGWEEKVALFNIKPLNVEERLSFILARPFSYQAYRQIEALMIEQQKQLAKHNLRRNHKK
ncbi:YpoC family protein [Bacillus sp. REN10]|uniref:YpoC family protein n=1 Tax=Bacillus sp. REN10 TaxID=2782541 RepID=UPI00193B797D|nr:hypothetical protein [Bacillus sp. REN10]